MAHRRHYNFTEALDDGWELIPDAHWQWTRIKDGAHFVNSGERADIWLRPCTLNGDSTTIELLPGTEKRGTLTFGYCGGFEFITVTVNLETGEATVNTHEFHKPQPRYAGTTSTDFNTIRIQRDECDLPGLPYSGSRLTVYLDEQLALAVEQIDFLPECHFTFGLSGPGEITLRSLSIDGPERPRPEFINVGVWQQNHKKNTAESVDGLITGVQAAADVGVEILLTPETSLTGLRDTDPELRNEALIQAAVSRFQSAVKATANAPHVLVGYPEWIDGSEVDGATLDRVCVNAHRFVRPDGSLGPRMAKVHSCEQHLWHGRDYNLQRVRGVEVALGICHDGRYDDVWATGVMAGARLCFHPLASGKLQGKIPDILKRYEGLGSKMDAWWVTVNAGGGAAIVYPQANRKVPQTVVSVPEALTEANPTYPDYTTMGDQLCYHRIRLWDAIGCWPTRTLRSGRLGYERWSQLLPAAQDV